MNKQPRTKKPIVTAARLEKIVDFLSEKGLPPSSLVILPDGSVTIVLDNQEVNPNTLDIEMSKWEASHR